MAALGGSPFSNVLFPVLGYAAGTAMGPALRPVIEDLTQDAWMLHAVRKPDALTLAAGVAQGQVDYSTAKDWARRHGFDQPEFDALVNIANVGPGAAYAFELWRREVIGEPGFRRAAKRLGLEAEWIDDLVALKQVLLSPAELAVMVQRTVVPNPGILPNQPDTAGSNVPPMPTVDIDVLKEAAGSGVDAERLKALTRIIGLPASPDLAARMHFRNIITEGAFNQAILEGNTRGEWAPYLLEGFRDILTSHEYAELELRGYLDRAQRLAGTRKHGMSDADSDHLYDVLGRSVTVRQVTTGLARDGNYPGSYANVPQPYRAAIQRGNLREEYAELAYANRYTYPSFFAIRALMHANVLSADQGHELLLEMGWKPSLARLVADFYGQATTAPADPHVTKAQTQLWSTTHRTYIANETTAAEAQARFALLAIPGAAQTTILQLWESERELIRKQLTPAQIKKAWLKTSKNYATGQMWTRDDAIAALVAQGYSTVDANDFLDIPSGP